MKTRQKIINDVRKQLAEVNQLFTDTEYWNENVRKPHEKRIDPDPDGEMAKIKAGYERCLANEIRISEPKTHG